MAPFFQRFFLILECSLQYAALIVTDGGYSVETEREKHVNRTTIIEIVWCTKFKKSSFENFFSFLRR